MYRFQDLHPAPAGAGATVRLPLSPRTFVPARAPSPPALRPRFNLVTDLGDNIGSAEWLRGAATCAALCYAAWSFLPEIAPIRGLAPPALTQEQWQEVEAMGIAPAAFGSGTGRRMGPADTVQAILNAPERPAVDLRASLASAGDLAGTLTRAGVSQADAAQVAGMVAGVTSLGDIAAGTVLDLRLGRREQATDPRPLEQLSFRASFALKIGVQRSGGALKLTATPIAVDATPLRIQGTIGPGLYRSARAAGVPARIVESYIRVLSTQIGVPSDLAPGDRFDIVVEHRRAETGESQTGALLYAGLDRAQGRDIQMMPWTIDGAAQWFEASGVGKETSSGFRTPVAGRMTSGFGYRVHPILRYRRMHTGVDFAAPHGAPIVATAAGQVVLAGWDGGYGRTVRIGHGRGMVTLYGHMSHLAVAPGQQVAAGQVIGYVGSTGMSTGPHLHYEVHVNGERVNPAGFRMVNQAQLSGGELEAFRGRMNALLALRPGAGPATPIQTASFSGR